MCYNMSVLHCLCECVWACQTNTPQAAALAGHCALRAGYWVHVDRGEYLYSCSIAHNAFFSSNLSIARHAHNRSPFSLLDTPQGWQRAHNNLLKASKKCVCVRDREREMWVDTKTASFRPFIYSLPETFIVLHHTYLNPQHGTQSYWRQCKIRNTKQLS